MSEFLWKQVVVVLVNTAQVKTDGAPWLFSFLWTPTTGGASAVWFHTHTHCIPTYNRWPNHRLYRHMYKDWAKVYRVRSRRICVDLESSVWILWRKWPQAVRTIEEYKTTTTMIKWRTQCIVDLKFYVNCVTMPIYVGYNKGHAKRGNKSRRRRRHENQTEQQQHRTTYSTVLRRRERSTDFRCQQASWQSFFEKIQNPLSFLTRFQKHPVRTTEGPSTLKRNLPRKRRHHGTHGLTEGPRAYHQQSGRFWDATFSLCLVRTW